MTSSDWTYKKADKLKASGYDPKDHGTRYYKKKDFEYTSYSKKTVLERISDARDALRSGYENPPSYAELEKVLTHALAEITNLEKRISSLQKESNQSDQDVINIQVGDETVVIDGDLATQVITRAVSDYVVKAIETAAYLDEIADNFKI